MIGCYLRLSLADGDLGKDDKEESNSIENQRLLLRTFVESRDDISGEIIEYIDDGYSGTNFERPSFKRMLEDAKKGKIHTIIVKDLSRLGRDYIGVGDYLEQVFPVLGIRFIAVNSMYDSNDYVGKTIGLDISINNLVNSLYSKDLSKKYKSAVRTKWKQGKSTMGRVPFGYKKVKTDKNKWEIDPEAAAYVRMIFEKALLGWNTSRIASYMNEIKAPTPGRYKEEHFDNYKQWNRLVNDEEWLWDTYKVWRIIKCYSYTGALVQGTVTAISVGSKTRRMVPANEQVVVDGVHPAIVTVQEWKDAQAAIRKTSQYSMPQKTGYPLTGKIRCGTCGLSMTYNDYGTPSLCCCHRRTVGKYSNCDGTVYEAKYIEGIVGYALRSKIALFQTLNSVLQKDKAQTGRSMPESCKRMEKDLETLKAKRIHLYESYAEGLLSKEAYLRKKEEMTEEIDGLQKKKDFVAAAISEQDSLLSRVEVISDQSAEILETRKLTTEIVDTYIDRVVIYDPKHIEVIFTFDDLLREAGEKVNKLQSEKGNLEEVE